MDIDTLNCGYEADLVAATNSIAGVQIGEAMHHKNLTVFPLSYRGGPAGVVGEAPVEAKKRYRLLADAIEEKSAKVEEVSDGGEVPFLAVDNQGAMGMAVSDQGEVWNQVSELLDDLGAAPPTGDFSAGFEAVEDRLEEYSKAMELPEGTCGFVAACGERVVGMDLFDDPETMHKLWRRMSKGYFSEALRDETRGTAGPRH
jgi:hypothetical protein